RAIHNGADDNASGVAALLEAARALAAAAPPRRTIVFAAFGAEEKGLLGSNHYVDRPPIPLERTVAMLNLDMVGRLREDNLHVFGVGTAQGFDELVHSRAKALGFDLTTSPDGYGPSDHASFYAAGIPVLHFFTGTHADYHRPSDDWDKVDTRGIARIAELTAALALEIADREERPVYIAQARPQPGAGGDGYGAYLGTIPDFGEVPEGGVGGVRISGVRAGSPAEKAGLVAGDVIVRFDERPIANLYDLTYALRDHTAGDTVRIGVHRGEGERTLTAVLGRRP
ncbi:MAG: M20/M25/M40 family metallo-hydrolase, partial [Gemmatimonadota bacterium]